MPELPDPRSLSPESLELWRALVVRAVIDLDMSQVDAATYYGVSPHTISEWVSRYREQGEESLAVQAQGRPQGAGRALSPEQEDEIRTLVVKSTPQQQQIASATWTRRAVAELIAKREGVELTLSWLQVLGRTEPSQIDQRVGHEFHTIMPTLLVLKPQQQPLEFVLPRERPLHSIP